MDLPVVFGCEDSDDLIVAGVSKDSYLALACLFLGWLLSPSPLAPRSSSTYPPSHVGRANPNLSGKVPNRQLLAAFRT
jgi:hypothetical protein